MKERNLDRIIEEALVFRRERITVSPKTSEKILDSSSLIRVRKATSPVFPVLAGVFLVVISGLILTRMFVGKERIMSRECLRVLSEMSDAFNNKDIDKSVSFFDLRGMGTDEKKFRKDISDVYGQFDRIHYETRDIVIKPGVGGAVAQTHYVLTMLSPDGHVFTSSGKDRIWFTETPEGLKILCRITEEDKKS